MDTHDDPGSEADRSPEEQRRERLDAPSELARQREGGAISGSPGTRGSPPPTSTPSAGS